ncbi:MAG: hypothetical protein QNK15_06705 [Cycloclasticus sp.]|nr:hypothetical protein [Cycloclasticus sp.]
MELQNIVEQKCRKPIRKFITGGKTTLPLLKVAYEKNIPFTHLGSAEYVLGWGAKSRLMLISTCDSDSAIGSKAAQNKVKTAQMLDLFGLPNPDQLVVSTKKAALTAAKRLGGKVVVKPVDRDRGEGVTIGIRNIEHLVAAFDSAKKFSKGPVIIEKEVPGVCHRLLISNGALLYAIKRNPISVAGNGKNTVKELINALESVERSKSPWLNPRRYPSDQYASVIMKNNGYSLDSKPKKGELVALRPFQSDAWGGTPEDVTSEVHVDNIAIAIKAAKVFGLNNAGIDIISSDITQPWHSNAAIINEVNFSPNMGASEIARNALPKFLESFINGDGRIPVDVYVGSGSALKVAIKKHKAQLKKGIKSSLTSHKLTLHLSEEEAHLPYTSLIRRCKAMLLDREVEALVVVVETTECLFNLMPFDAINSLTIVDSDLYSWKNKDKKALAEEVGDLHQLFKKTKQSTKNKNNV